MRNASIYSAVLPSLVAGKSLWSEKPGTYEDLITTAYPLGNGALGGRVLFNSNTNSNITTAMPLGAYGKEIVNLNIDSLWRGGPFESSVRTNSMRISILIEDSRIKAEIHHSQ